jgi:hypothetical protein
MSAQMQVLCASPRNGICIPVLGCIYAAVLASIELYGHRTDIVPRSLKTTDLLQLRGGRLLTVSTVPDGRCLLHALAMHRGGAEALERWAARPFRCEYPITADGRSDDTAYADALSQAKELANIVVAKLDSSSPTAARLRVGAVPEESDVPLIAKALGLSLRVWWLSGACEVINAGSSSVVDVVFSELVQSDGCRKGHFTFATPASSATSAPSVSLVTHGITGRCGFSWHTRAHAHTHTHYGPGNCLASLWGSLNFSLSMCVFI